MEEGSQLAKKTDPGMTPKFCRRTGPSRKLLAREAACRMGKPLLRTTQPTALSTPANTDTHFPALFHPGLAPTSKSQGSASH